MPTPGQVGPSICTGWTRTHPAVEHTAEAEKWDPIQTRPEVNTGEPDVEVSVQVQGAPKALSKVVFVMKPGRNLSTVKHEPHMVVCGCGVPSVGVSRRNDATAIRLFCISRARGYQIGTVDLKVALLSEDLKRWGSVWILSPSASSSPTIKNRRGAHTLFCDGAVWWRTGRGTAELATRTHTNSWTFFAPRSFGRRGFICEHRDGRPASTCDGEGLTKERHDKASISWAMTTTARRSCGVYGAVDEKT